MSTNVLVSQNTWIQGGTNIAGDILKDTQNEVYLLYTEIKEGAIWAGIFQKYFMAKCNI